mmetsp:Transcript_2910/g.6520  ORF Transcript_2910/g.6520 Transcript_2910/m.6520 type:complete len:281 (+) Transcript_2910:262-1104(+)
MGGAATRRLRLHRLRASAPQYWPPHFSDQGHQHGYLPVVPARTSGDAGDWQRPRAPCAPWCAVQAISRRLARREGGVRTRQVRGAPLGAALRRGGHRARRRADTQCGGRAGSGAIGCATADVCQTQGGHGTREEAADGHASSAGAGGWRSDWRSDLARCAAHAGARGRRAGRRLVARLNPEHHDVLVGRELERARAFAGLGGLGGAGGDQSRGGARQQQERGLGGLGGGAAGHRSGAGGEAGGGLGHQEGGRALSVWPVRRLPAASEQLPTTAAVGRTHG